AVGDDHQNAGLVDQHAQAQTHVPGDHAQKQQQNGGYGDKNVLLDDAHDAAAQLDGHGYFVQPVLHQDDVGRFHGHVGARRAHRDADVRRGQGGGVVDAVTNHGHGVAL